MLITADNKSELNSKFSSGVEKIKKWPVSVDILEGAKTRSLDQNALQHKHYKEISEIVGLSPSEAKCYCKYHFGVPIMMSRDSTREDFVDFSWAERLEYSEAMKAMAVIDLTSLFYASEAYQYTDEIMRHFAENGYKLTDPSDKLIQYWETEIAKERAKR